MRLSLLVAALSSLLLGGCESASSAESSAGDGVAPTFEVRGDAEGLMLVWFDEDGAHTAPNRSAIPEAHREHVRVDDLTLAPEERADPDHVFVADMRSPEEGDRYAVRRMERDRFDALIEAASRAEASPAPVEPGSGADVIVYGASWCNACRGAAAFLRERQVPFVERDIEQEPDARRAMVEAARAAGVRTQGIPVIDFRGEIIAGFDQTALEAAIARSRTPI